MNVQIMNAADSLKNGAGRATQTLGLRPTLFLIMLAVAMAALTLPAIALAGDRPVTEPDCSTPPRDGATAFGVPGDCDDWATIPVEPTATPIGDKRKPTATPKPEPTATPTPVPTRPPLNSPTPEPTPVPTKSPTPAPTPVPAQQEQRPVTAPGAVASVSVSRSDGSVTAGWPAVDGATKYHVTYTTDGGASWRAPVDDNTNVPTNSLTFSGDNTKTYTVGVRAGNSAGWGGWTNSAPSAPYTPPLVFSEAVADHSWIKGTAIDRVTLPTASRAKPKGEVAYTLTPALPAGLSFDAAARTITGTPSKSAKRSEYTYTATDTEGSATLTFAIEVGVGAISFGDATVDDQTWAVDEEIEALTLPAVTREQDGASTQGGAFATASSNTTPNGGALTYALSPDLPKGLTFDAGTRTITGTPTEVTASAKYTYTATDGTDTVMLSFNIEVTDAKGARAQSGLSWVTSPPTLLEWTQGVAVNVTLPAATGDPNITYRLTQGGGSKGPQLPQGITWNASTRTLSGTPTKWFSTRVATYDAHASNKSTPAVRIHIRVSDTSGNHAPYASIKSSGSQLLGQLWSRYGDCYSGSVTFAPSSGHSKHFYDPEDDTLTYTAGSNKLVSTTINSSGYAVASLRHPPLNWYSFHYTATDPDGLYDSISLQVKHFDCKETLSVQENKPKDTVVASVGGPNKADGSSFTLNGDVATYFDIDSSTGQITVKDGTTLDYETKTSYSGNFRYTVENTSVGGNLQINVNDVRAPNVDRPTLAQNSTNPTTSLDVSWTAPTPMTGTTLNDYDVRYREWGTSTWTEMPDTTNSLTTSTTITGLTAGKEYEVQVRSQIADEGPGHWSGSSVILYLAENTAVNGNVGGKFNVNATDFWPLSFTLGGTDGSKFKTSNDTGYKTAQSAQIQVKTGNVPDFESKSSYSLTLRAVENNLNRNILDVTYSVLVIVTDVSEPPAAPSAPTVAVNSTTPTTKLDVSWTAPTMTGKPAISDYDVQYRQTGVSTWSSHSFTGTGTSTTLSGLTAGKKYDVQVRAVNDEGNGAWSDTGNAITTSSSVTRSVAENTAASGNVGAAVTMTAGSYTLAHSLSGTDASKFDIGSTTGQITVKTGNVPDYESKTSYSVTVSIAVSGTGNSNSAPNGTGAYTVPVTINVTDVNEPPPKMGTPTVSANTTTPTTKLDVSWTAPTTTQMSGKPAVSDYDVQYRLSGGSTWTDASYTGAGTSTTLTGLTKGKSYEVQVRAVNAEGNGDWSDSGAAITDANAVSRSVAENSAANTNVGAAVTAKANSGYTYTHALSGTDASKFTIESSSGQIKVKSGTSLDYETKTSYTVTVTVTVANKNAGVNAQSLDPNAPGDYTVPVTINVTDVNEPPAFSDDSVSHSIAENSAAGTNIGSAVTATDPDGVAKFNTLAYSLSGTDASKFNIGSGTGQITVKTGNIPNYEAKISYSVTVNVTDGKAADGTADTATDDTIAVTINVTDVNEPPPAPGAPSVSQNSTTPTTKLDVSWTAPSTTGKPAVSDYDVRYRKSGDSTWTDASFTGTTTSTTISGLTVAKSYEVQVRAVNAEGNGAWSASGTAITKGGTMTRSIDENSAAGTNVGAAVTASNTTYDYTHALSGTDASKFSISSSTGQITVGTGTTLDYESKSSYSVVVTVTAAAKTQGANAQSLDPNAPGDYVVPVTINVNDVNEPPTISAPTVTPNSTTPTTKLDVSWTAPTMTGKPAVTDYDVQYRKAHSSAWTSHSFTGTGTSTTITGLTENEHYEVQVKAINAEGNSGWSNPGHATTNADSKTLTIDENSAANAEVGTVTKTIDSSYTKAHTLSGTDASKFDIASATGVITLANGTSLNFEAKDHYDVVVELDATKQGSTTLEYNITVIIQVDDVLEPPARLSEPKVAKNATNKSTKLDVSWTAPDMTGKPAIADYDVRYRQHGANNWTDASFSGTGTSTTLTGLTEGKSYEAQVRATNAEGTSGWSPSGAAITDAGLITDITRSIAENSVAGTNVGSPVTATSNPNGYTLTHELSGTDAAKFTIESSSGQIKVKAGNIPNYEAKTQYEVIVTVKAAESGGGVNAQSFTLDPNAPGDYIVPVAINVTDVKEPPAKPDAPAVTSTGTSDNLTLNVTWTAPDMKGKPPITDYDVRYKKDGGSWTSHSFTGTGKSTTIPNLVGGVVYKVQVRATNDEGTSGWSDSGALANVEPWLPSPTLSIAENSADGTNVGSPVAATDPDSSTLYYTMTGTDAASFEIDGSTAQITLADDIDVDYEAKTSYSVKVRVSDRLDSEGNADTRIDHTITVTINVTDVKEPLEAPGTPTRKSATLNSITATWTAPDATGKPPVTKYWVRYWEQGRKDVAYSVWTVYTNEALLDEIPDTQNPSAPLKPGRAYQIEVMAENDEGYGAWSATATLYTKAPQANTPTTPVTPTPTPATPTPVPTVTPTPVTPTPTPVTPTPVTPTSVTPTPTPVPTATPTPVPTATPTPAPPAANYAPTPTPTVTPAYGGLGLQISNPDAPLRSLSLGNIGRADSYLPVRQATDTQVDIPAPVPPAPQPTDDSVLSSLWWWPLALMPLFLLLFAFRRRKKRQQQYQ